MVKNLFTSNEFATVIVLAATASLVLLYMKGLFIETIIGAVILGIAAVLIILGGRRKNPDRD